MGTFKSLRGLTVPVCLAAGLLSVVASSASAEIRLFSYTGSQQTFTVPKKVKTINVIATGGSGGRGACLTPPSSLGLGEIGGGSAAIVSANLSVTSGKTLYVEVGGAGVTAYDLIEADERGLESGWNGGGSAGGGGSPFAGGGGGASDVRTIGSTSPGSLQSRLIVAGGGGGGGEAHEYEEPDFGCNDLGGSGGLPDGSNGIINHPFHASGGVEGGGYGGTLTAGGAGGSASQGGKQVVGGATAGSLGLGGTGGSGCNNAGGGGGGGFYGGGGGGGSISGCHGTGGGGGGSSYGPSGATFALTSDHPFAEGPGSVIISWNGKSKR
jgi:hypothetical protein